MYKKVSQVCGGRLLAAGGLWSEDIRLSGGVCFGNSESNVMAPTKRHYSQSVSLRQRTEQIVSGDQGFRCSVGSCGAGDLPTIESCCRISEELTQ